MKLLRTLRLDLSDTLSFPQAAPPGEWAIPGGFAFTGVDPATLPGKERVAFRSGFLGLPSLGWSTLAQIVTASAEDRDAAVALLAQGLVKRFGAPSIDAAREAAVAEIDFTISLCDHPIGTVIAVHRTSEGGDIRERFRRLQPRPDGGSCEAFSFAIEPDEAPAEKVDLTALAQDKRL